MFILRLLLERKYNLRDIHFLFVFEFINISVFKNETALRKVLTALSNCGHRETNHQVIFCVGKN